LISNEGQNLEATFQVLRCVFPQQAGSWDMDKKKYSKPVVTEQKITLGVYGEYERTLTPDDRRGYHGGQRGPLGDH
jgi:hypothetical protein